MVESLYSLGQPLVQVKRKKQKYACYEPRQRARPTFRSDVEDPVESKGIYSNSYLVVTVSLPTVTQRHV